MCGCSRQLPGGYPPPAAGQPASRGFQPGPRRPCSTGRASSPPLHRVAAQRQHRRRHCAGPSRQSPRRCAAPPRPPRARWVAACRQNGSPPKPCRQFRRGCRGAHAWSGRLHQPPDHRGRQSAGAACSAPGGQAPQPPPPAHTGRPASGPGRYASAVRRQHRARSVRYWPASRLRCPAPFPGARARSCHCRLQHRPGCRRPVARRW
ncbi:hypothetical protein D3C81_1424250 [compost metagenome]